METFRPAELLTYESQKDIDTKEREIEADSRNEPLFTLARHRRDISPNYWRRLPGNVETAWNFFSERAFSAEIAKRARGTSETRLLSLRDRSDARFVVKRVRRVARAPSSLNAVRVTFDFTFDKLCKCRPR